jgi:hypothetical protein
MEMFDAHRRDILNFDNYMDLKKPGFGGPKSAIALRDNKGSLVDKTPKLDGYRRTVERDPAFSHPVYDPTYKAMTHDLVYKQEKRKPFTYDDTRTGIPVVEIEPLKEGKTYTSFNRFINEADETEDDEEFRSSATQSNLSLSQIEASLRGFEGGDGQEEDIDFGANPMDDEDYGDYEEAEDTPFGKKPQWIIDLENSSEEEY